MFIFIFNLTNSTYLVEKLPYVNQKCQIVFFGGIFKVLLASYLKTLEAASLLLAEITYFVPQHYSDGFPIH